MIKSRKTGSKNNRRRLLRRLRGRLSSRLRLGVTPHSRFGFSGVWPGVGKKPECTLVSVGIARLKNLPDRLRHTPLFVGMAFKRITNKLSLEKLKRVCLGRGFIAPHLHPYSTKLE